ncbi:MAG: hypothetical protein HY204_03665 [Nitrospirae bacterium]|nr:hypothetical protein [Nitrospirota bacterium]MBI3662287.1 hypothetical protein [Acidobacteriota bacterium]
MNFTEIDWRVALLAAAGVLLAAGGFAFWWRRRPRDPQEIERRRRAHVNQVGRIVEGEVLEIRETLSGDLNAGPKRRASDNGASNGTPRNVVVYSYSISGVTYQTAQDITGLEERACVGRIVTGLPVSVKYDPANPGNSILVADNWSGVH